MSVAVERNMTRYERARRRVDTLERARLGDAMMGRSGYMAADMGAAFKPEWFRSPLHRAVFAAMLALLNRGACDLDVGSVIAEMQHQGTYERFTGAAAYVCSLTEGIVPPPSPHSRLFRLEELRRAWRELDATQREAR